MLLGKLDVSVCETWALLKAFFKLQGSGPVSVTSNPRAVLYNLISSSIRAVEKEAHETLKAQAPEDAPALQVAESVLRDQVLRRAAVGQRAALGDLKHHRCSSSCLCSAWRLQPVPASRLVCTNSAPGNAVHCPQRLDQVVATAGTPQVSCCLAAEQAAANTSVASWDDQYRARAGWGSRMCKG